MILAKVEIHMDDSQLTPEIREMLAELMQDKFEEFADGALDIVKNKFGKDLVFTVWT